MKFWFIGGLLVWVFFFSARASAQTDVLVNGSFESGLTGWTTATQLATGASGSCSYNGVTAPGTETGTSLPGFPATDGTQTALGSVADSSGTSAIISCVLYQDVAIPAGATTATFSFDIGAKGGVDGGIHTAARVGVYSTAAAPGFSSATVTGSSPVYAVATADTTLHSQTSGSFNISGRAGQTVRFAIINASQTNAGEMIGIDNVKFLVNATQQGDANVPTLSGWALIGLGLLLGMAGFQFLRRLPA